MAQSSWLGRGARDRVDHRAIRRRALVYTKCADGKDVVVGHVRVWEPAKRIVVSWEISAKWKPDSRVAYASEVEVVFVAQTADTTRVELEHRDFERMGPSDGATMRKSVDGGWPAILEFFAQEAGKTTSV